MKQFIVLLAGAAVFLSSCGNLGGDSQKKVTIDDQYEVFYEGEVTEEEAEALGEYLAKKELFDEEGDKAKLTKEDDAYIVRLVYDEDVYKKTKDLYLFGLNTYPGLISKNVFDGEETQLILADENFEDVQEVKKLNSVKVNSKSIIYYRGAGVTKSDAQKLGDYLLNDIKYFDTESSKMLLLTHQNGEYVVRFIVDGKKVKENEEEVIHAFQVFQHLLSQKVFGGQKATVIITDTRMKDIQDVGELTSQEKAAINDELDRVTNPELFETDSLTYPELDSAAVNFSDTTFGY
jgi:hypothetical protein